MTLLNLKYDFAFKLLFVKNPDLLLDLINSFPSFEGEKQIKSIKILNPELPKSLKDDKLSILDIHAEDNRGQKFNIEMQMDPHENYNKRILYYWSKLYSSSLKSGNKYNLLKKVISISFLDFELFPKEDDFYSEFMILKKSNPNIYLTDNLEIYIVELSKFTRKLSEIKSSFESWIYTIKESNHLKEEEMATLAKNNPKLKKTFEEIRVVSKTEKKFLEALSREKYEKDQLQRRDELIEKVRTESKNEGKIEGKNEIALNLLLQNVKLEIISKATGLTLVQLKELQKKLKSPKKKSAKK